MTSSKNLVVNDKVRISEGSGGKWFFFISGQPEAFVAEQDIYLIVEAITNLHSSDSLQLSRKLGISPETLRERIDLLRAKNILIPEATGDHSAAPNDHRTSTHATENASKHRFLSKVSKYTYFISEVTNVKILTSISSSINFAKYNYLLLPIIFPLAVIATYKFYWAPINALGREITAESFYSPSLLEVFSVFMLTSILTVFYKVAVGFQQPYRNSALYVKLLAGFHPVLSTNEDQPYSSQFAQSKTRYLAYIASPYIMRILMYMLSILIIYLFYPFLIDSSQELLSVLLTTINITIIGVVWQIIPSPGTVSYKALELYRVLPTKLMGRSFREIRLWYKSKKTGISNAKLPTKYIIFLFLALCLVISKTLFLFFYVLPEFSLSIPQFLGTWTSDIVFLLLVILSINYMIGSYSPSQTGTNRLPQDARIITAYGSVAYDNSQSPANSFSSFTNQTQRADHPRSSSTIFDRFDANAIRSWFSKRYLLLILLVLFFPFVSTVAGSATIEQSMSLTVKSGEQETSVVREVVRRGPSAETVKKGDTILILSSSQLDTLISQTRDSLQSLRSEESVLKTQQQAVVSGSTYEEAKNNDDIIRQVSADVRSNSDKLRSLRNQIDILKRQVDIYRTLAAGGALSEVQYQDKYIELQEALGKLYQLEGDLSKAQDELIKAQRTKTVDQNLRRNEDINEISDKIKGIRAEIARSEKMLLQYQLRKSELTIKAPFDCVIESDTSLLMNRVISSGDDLLSIRSVPTESVVVSIPEYDRSRISIGDEVELRLYSRLNKTFQGKVSSISPVSSEEKDQEMLNVDIKLDQTMSSPVIGSTGTAKIKTGVTCLFWNLVKPVFRFLFVDVWSMLP